jgi:hypothetical protein
MAHCESCMFRRYAERKPQSLLARLWRWHTRWCPGWKAYQRRMVRQDQRPREQAIK